MEFQTKEQIITSYLSKIDFTKDGWGYRKIQEDLRKLIGEAPAMNFNYKKDVVLNEFNSEAKEISVIESIDVIYTPNLDEKGKKLTYEIGGKINS
tara:strand:- start:2443 stop:2727 length:285 start_codon:yes stop_codon:yes gene_type:complete